MELFAKIVDCIQLLTIFGKHFLLSDSQGYEYMSEIKILVCCHLSHKKLGLESLQISPTFKFNFTFTFLP